MTNSNLIIICTLLSSAKPYLKTFNLRTTRNNIKAISSSASFDKIRECPQENLNEIDLIILPDRFSHSPSFKEYLQLIIPSKHKIKLTVHKSDHQKERKIDIVTEIAKDKLITPVLYEHSTSGDTFDFMINLASIWQKKDQSTYFQSIEKFINHQTVDLLFEAKMELWSYSSSELEEAFSGIFKNPSTALYIHRLINEPQLKDILYLLVENSSHKKLAHKMILRNLLFESKS